MTIADPTTTPDPTTSDPTTSDPTTFVRDARREVPPSIGDTSAVGYIGPNWFASVMGTGIVATAGVSLPVQGPVLRGWATAVWLLASLLLIMVTAATVAHWVRHPLVARSHLDHPVMSHFYGAPAMALLTVGAGALLVGQPLLGAAAVPLSAGLWTAGTALGLWTAVAVPVKAFTSHHTASDSAFGGWLMPVVPPMVSAATGAQLIPHLSGDEGRQTLLFGCWALFGMSLLAGLIIITLLWNRLVQHKVGAPAMVPTLWIVLGVLGQSITAAHHLGLQAAVLLPDPYGPVFEVIALAYGVPVWGFALLWLAIAATITIRTARRRLPFSLTWWSFTFPVGTVVTGTAGLAAATGLMIFSVAAVVLYVVLVGAWITVGVRTVRGVRQGTLLAPPDGQVSASASTGLAFAAR